MLTHSSYLLRTSVYFSRGVFTRTCFSKSENRASKIFLPSPPTPKIVCYCMLVLLVIFIRLLLLNKKDTYFPLKVCIHWRVTESTSKLLLDLLFHLSIFFYFQLYTQNSGRVKRKKVEFSKMSMLRHLQP